MLRCEHMLVFHSFMLHYQAMGFSNNTKECKHAFISTTHRAFASAHLNIQLGFSDLRDCILCVIIKRQVP